MKTKRRIVQSLLVVVLLLGGAMKSMAQNPGNLPSSSATQSVCLGETQQYAVRKHLSTSYIWSIITNPSAPIPLAGGTIATPLDSITEITWTTAGTCILQLVETNLSGCSDTSRLTVTVNPTPSIVITNPTAVCSPSTVDLTVAAVTAGSTSGLTFTYWTDATATTSYTTPTAATAGTYYIKGTTASGCFDIQPVVVTINPTPTVVVTNPTAVCSPSTVDLTVAAVTEGSTLGLTFTYWTDATATTSYTTPTAATAGTYYIKGSTTSGCFDIQPVVVTVNPTPTVVVTNPTAVCSPSTVDLTVEAVTAGSTTGLTFTYWTDATATTSYTTPTAAIAGTYYIKGTTASGCFDIQPVVVTVNPIPSPSVTGVSPVCEGETQTYTTAATGNTFFWTVIGGTINSGQTTNTIIVTWTAAPGSVSVLETIGLSSCSVSNTLNVVVNPIPATSPIWHN